MPHPTQVAQPFLADVAEPTLRELFARAKPQRYAAGSVIVSELESGADVYVLTMGEAEVSVDARDGERQVLGKLGPGAGFGEMSSRTGELRSATVTAVTVSLPSWPSVAEGSPR